MQTDQVFTSRKHHFLYLVFWILSLILIFIIHNTILDGNIFNLDGKSTQIFYTLFKIIEGLVIISIIANGVSLIFREIKYGFAIDHLVVRKFLPTIRFITLLLIWIVGGFLILESLNINTSGLLAGAGIGGAIFALASKDIIANLLGSLSIIMSKTFEIGDTIRIKNMEGIVEEINMNYTKIMSNDGKVVYIPNRSLSVEQIENITRRRFFVYTYRVPIKKTLGNPKEVRDILNIIEGKLNEYSPIEIKITTEIPNATDFVYIFTVKVPEEDEKYDKEIREFLIQFIFPEEKHEK